ncbi:sirohydrochlorin chelatase [Bacillus massiliigorillae]|uniref:sirohydrochlorin chelatase n=1 Tax=Bacillus massiliigorillae TaxID=1243664 RepID=UPI0003AAA267|nr:sirohydrochlorin chelatase [Bacillus massiliigorillae]
MQAVLFICHGSRRKVSCAEAIAFMKECQNEFSQIPIVEYGFLELATPTIEDGFESCIKQGATKIAVVPFLLLAAGHVMYDIPQELVRLQSQYPSIKLSYGNPIGVTNKMSQLVLDQVNGTNVNLNEAHIIIVGRGSRMLEVQRQLEEIIAPVRRVYHSLSISYLTGCKPSFVDSLNDALHAGYSTIIVVPYLIFSGVLTEKIDQTVHSLNIQNKQVIITAPLSTHPNMKLALFDRVKEAV